MNRADVSCQRLKKEQSAITNDYVQIKGSFGHRYLRRRMYRILLLVTRDISACVKLVIIYIDAIRSNKTISNTEPQ